MTRRAGWVVAFDAGAGRTGPLTVGQINQLRFHEENPEENLSKFWRLRPSLTFAEISALMRTLIERHEALRTTIRTDLEPVAQEVRGSGELHVALHDCTSGEPWTLRDEVAAAMSAAPFRYPGELPVRAAIVTEDGKPVWMVLVVCHTATDRQGLDVLTSEIRTLAEGRELPPPALHPIDLAVEEQAASRRDSSAARHWRSILTRAPQAMFAVPAPADPPEGDLCERVRFRAPTELVDAVSRRVGADRSAVLLTAYTALIGHATSQPHCVVTLLSGNRFTPRLRTYPGTLVQDALMLADLRAATFDSLLPRVRTASFKAYRQARFDARAVWDVIDEINHTRGMSFSRDCVYDNITGTDAGEPSAVLEVTDLPPSRKPGIMTLTVLGWLDLVLTTDPRHLPSGYGRVFGDALLALLTAAARADVPLSGLTETTGLIPFARSSDDWVHLDSCWVSLPAVRSLVGDAVDHHDFTLTRDLACHLPSGDPAAAHAACVTALPGRLAVLTPRTYTSPSHPPIALERPPDL
ncbi:condensation domain-containing protein [Streptosporangium saharense]|uniref:condensation domain-containing protein n=1 Tax=Streptosporangium saharense TaxID=1706840 RepID=UPI003330C7CD